MRIIRILLLCTIFIWISCKMEQEKEIAKEDITAMETTPFKYWTWITANPSKTDTEYVKEFKKYKENGIKRRVRSTRMDVYNEQA